MDAHVQIMNAKSERPLPKLPPQPQRKQPRPHRPQQLLLRLLLPPLPNPRSHLPLKKPPQLPLLQQRPLQRPRQVLPRRRRLTLTQVNVTQFVMNSFMHVSVHVAVIPVAHQNVAKLIRHVLMHVTLLQQLRRQQLLPLQPLMAM